MNEAVSMRYSCAGNMNVTMRCLTWPDTVQGVVVRKVSEPCLAVQSTHCSQVDYNGGWGK